MPIPNTPNISEDEFFQKYTPNVSEDEFFDKYDPNKSAMPFKGYGDPELRAAQDTYMQAGPFSGPEADHMFHQSGAGKILSAVGQGAVDGWGSTPSLFEQEMKFEAERKEADKGIVSGVHDAVMRPLASLLDGLSIGKAFGAIGGAFSGGVGQLGQNLSEVNKQVIEADPNHPNFSALVGAPFGASGDLFKTAAAGGMTPEFPHAVQDHVQDFLNARSKGVIGESESGFFKARPPTEEDLQGRARAAEQAGVTPEPPVEQDAVPTIHDLARQIDPDLYKELDQLEELQKTIRFNIENSDYFKQNRINELDLEEHSILSRLGGKSLEFGEHDESQLPQVLQDRLANVRALREAVKNPSYHTPEELSLRQHALETDINIRETIADQRQAEKSVEDLLNSQSPEGSAFRDLVQSQAFEKAIADEPKISEHDYINKVQSQLFEKAIALENIKPKIIQTYKEAAELQEPPIPPKTETKVPTKLQQPKKTPAQVEAQEALKDAPKVPESVPSFTTTPGAIAQEHAAEVSHLEALGTADAERQLTERRGSGRGLTEGTKETGTSNSIEEELVQHGFEDYISDKSLYDPISYKEQGQRAVSFVNNNINEATKIIQGSVDAPADIHPIAIFKALKLKAFEDGDVPLIQELAKSPYNRQISEAGQTLGLTQGMFDRLDPSEIINNIQDSIKEAGKRKLNKTIDEIKNALDEHMQGVMLDVDKFLKSIECDY